jgi:hypothetical protein
MMEQEWEQVNRICILSNILLYICPLIAGSSKAVL